MYDCAIHHSRLMASVQCNQLRLWLSEDLRKLDIFESAAVLDVALSEPTSRQWTESIRHAVAVTARVMYTGVANQTQPSCRL